MNWTGAWVRKLTGRESKTLSDNLQKLRRQPGEDDAEHGGGDDSDEDGLVALLLRQSGRRKADDDRVVARKHEVIMIACRKADRASAVRSSLIFPISFAWPSASPVTGIADGDALVTHQEPGDRLDLTYRG